MFDSPEDMPYRRGYEDSADPGWRFRTWTARQWDRIAPDRRPRGATRMGGLRVEILCGARTDSGEVFDPSPADAGPSMPPAGRPVQPAARRRRDARADSIIVDPAMPTMGEWIRHAILEGLIRTVPAGDGRIYLIPIGAAPRNLPGHAPRPGP